MRKILDSNIRIQKNVNIRVVQICSDLIKDGGKG